MSTASEERIQNALRLLVEEVREQIDRHPAGHMIAGRGEPLDLRLALPTAVKSGNLEPASRDAAAAIQEGIQALLAHGAVREAGRVFCLRCASARCAHAAPTHGRQVFAGYGPTGLPRFRDFGQLLLERRDPRIDQLYREPPQLVALAATGDELAGQLLPAFRDAERGYRLHGQVAAGWYRDRAGGVDRPFAVSFQVVSSKPRAGRRRFGLNVVGVGPDGEPLEHLFDRQGGRGAGRSRGGEIPWADAVRWAQAVLDGIGRSQSHGRPVARPRGDLDGRLAGLVAALARRLEKGSRGRDRRTLHAEERHAAGDRPTRMALADLARAEREDLLFDVRSEALVVVGERGRTHLFSLGGKLVTSVRYAPAAIEKRRQSGLWRPAAPAEVASLKARLAADGDPEPA